jgi:methionyl-tRNA formyltransferase
MLGTLTRLPLAALLAADVELCGMVLPTEIVPPFQLVGNGRSPSTISPIRHEPAMQKLLPTLQMVSPLALAAAHDVPAFAVRRLAAAKTVAALAEMQPDVICVSCFPHRLPPAVLNLPPLGCLNVHPSLLPRFRGPAPLFWALRAGVAETGVTIHFMDEGFDTGDVALQRPFSLTEGLTHAEIETRLAHLGGKLLVEALQKLAAGTLPRLPQPPGFSSDPWPGVADFALDMSWSARHAFNFMRGTGNWERPYFVQVQGERVWLETALSYDPNARLPRSLIRQGQTIQLQFSPGVLTASVTRMRMVPD